MTSNILHETLKEKEYKGVNHSIMDILSVVDVWLPKKFECDDPRYAMGYNDAIKDLRDRLY